MEILRGLDASLYFFMFLVTFLICGIPSKQRCSIGPLSKDWFRVMSKGPFKGEI